MTTDTTVFEIEYTDTCSGEANYSWVKRYIIELPDNVSDTTLKRIAKQHCGLTGIRGIWENLGDTLQFKPNGMCTVLFITAIID